MRRHDGRTGRRVAWQRRHFDHGTLLRFDQTVVAVYLTTQRIYVIQDNWPVHFHPALLAALAETLMDELTQTVWAWLDQWLAPAPDLLRYVGLLCPS